SAIGIPSRHAAQVSGTTILGMPVFLVLYAIVGSIYFFRHQKPSAEMANLWQLNRVLLVVMAIYFAVNPFSPHYFVWLSIFITLAIVFQPKILPWYGLGVLGWAIMGIFGHDVTWFSQNLLVPISTDLFRTPQLPLILQTRLST